MQDKLSSLLNEEEAGEMGEDDDRAHNRNLSGGKVDTVEEEEEDENPEMEEEGDGEAEVEGEDEMEAQMAHSR